MGLKLQFVFIFASLITFVFVIKKIQKHGLDIDDAIVWILWAILLLVISIFPQIPTWISNKIGFSKETDPEKIEKDLLKTFNKKDWADVNHLFVWHGRYTCIARSPKCEICPIKKYCNEYKRTIKTLNFNNTSLHSKSFFGI